MRFPGSELFRANMPFPLATMNLLVTNTRNTQAYIIIRALRPHAQKIVATMYGESRIIARLSHAANSLMVDKRFYVPSPVEDWRAGRIQSANTEKEESYVRAVERICEQEEIDTIFPSWDPKVYVYSKNRDRFARMGIQIPVPDYHTVITPLDKYRTVRAAEDVGFPCPRTYLPENEDDLTEIARVLGFPLVIKPRFGSGAQGLALVRDPEEFFRRASVIMERQQKVIVQEFIPGDQIQHISLLLDKKGELKVAFGSKNRRNFLRLTQNLSTASESIDPYPYAHHAVKLVEKFGWWGCVNVQMKVDARDGIPKLMEINPRFGSRRWNRIELGINEALMCVKIAQGKKVAAVKAPPAGVMFTETLEDLLGLGFKLLDLFIYKLRVGILGRVPVDPSNPPLSLKKLIHSYKNTYLVGKRRISNPYFRYFFQDPFVSLIWWSQFFVTALRSAGRLGR